MSSLEQVDVLLKKLISTKKIPGLAITVLKDNTISFQKGYGYASIEDKTIINPKQTVFRIASVSKPIAATALAHMVADKQIDLDASFYKYVPYYPKKKWDFTIRQLASHTAGIRSYRGKEYGLNKSYTIKESITIFKDDDLLFKPGTNYHYNSFDWVLISLAIQEVSGIPFEDYVQKKVLQPLGMLKTSPENLKTNGLGLKKENQASFYSKSKLGFKTAIPVNNYYKLAGGGYLSTTEDIAKLGRAYLEDRIRDTTIVHQFISTEIINAKPTYYGLGWQVSEDKEGRSYYGHIGNGVGAYANFFVYPKEQIVISIMINCTNPMVQEELDEAIAILVTGDQKIA